MGTKCYIPSPPPLENKTVNTHMHIHSNNIMLIEGGLAAAYWVTDRCQKGVAKCYKVVIEPHLSLTLSPSHTYTHTHIPTSWFSMVLCSCTDTISICSTNLQHFQPDCLRSKPAVKLPLSQEHRTPPIAYALLLFLSPPSNDTPLHTRILLHVYTTQWSQK